MFTNLQPFRQCLRQSFAGRRPGRRARRHAVGHAECGAVGGGRRFGQSRQSQRMATGPEGRLGQ